MNLVSVRKRLERLENIHKTQIEAAALANARATPMSPAEEDLQMLFLLWFRCRRSSSGTAEDEAEWKRLCALYPAEVQAYEDRQAKRDAMSPEAYEEYMKALEESEL
jgi:hypothetical protein